MTVAALGLVNPSTRKRLLCHCEVGCGRERACALAPCSGTSEFGDTLIVLGGGLGSVIQATARRKGEKRNGGFPVKSAGRMTSDRHRDRDRSKRS